MACTRCELRKFREFWSNETFVRVGSECFASQPNAKALVDARRLLAVRAILKAFPGVAAGSYEVREGRVLVRNSEEA